MKTSIAAALLIAPAPLPALAQQGALNCGGTEPFWNVTHTGQTMWYTTPEVQRLDLVPVRARNADGRPPDLVRVYQTRRAGVRDIDGRGDVTLIVTRNEQTCSDGMSDRRVPYDAVYIDGQRVLYGCCRWTQ